jgi:hypothetical protein
MDLCHECRVKKGQKRKDKGAHTAIVKKCDDCGKRKGILADRHWVSEYPNGMVLQ